PGGPGRQGGGVTPAGPTRIGRHEDFDGGLRDVLERVRQKARVPVGGRSEQHDRRLRAHLEYERTGVVAGLGIRDALEAHVERVPSGKWEVGSGKSDL